MIKVLSSGRLANHMFQYAFARAAAAQLNTSFLYESDLLPKYFNLNSDSPSFLEKVIFKLTSDKSITEFTNLQSAEEILPVIQNNSVMAGYFQSESFFERYSNEIRSDFSIKNEILNAFKTKYFNELSSEYCCVAIRLSDYKEWTIGDGLNVSPLLPFAYFKEALQKVDSKKMIFISDQIDEVKKEFHEIYPNAIYNERCSDPIEDFLLLKFASSAIISNSSFYWWACWLNENSSAKIYVPEYWLGFRKKMEYPAGIIPKRWIQIPVSVKE